LKKTKKKYADRSDLEKLKSQWTKIQGLHSREEWSAGVVRAATAAEIAANIIIRHRLNDSNLEPDFIDHLLRWSNGIQGKMQKLIQPLCKDLYEKADFSKMQKLVNEINKERNDIVHSGYFCSEKKSREIIEKSRQFIIMALKSSHANIEGTMKQVEPPTM